MTTHALLSPSSAHRWRVCKPSARLGLSYPSKSSKYADEGTAAHTLASWCLEQGVDAAHFAGRMVPVVDRETGASVGWPVSPMVEPVQGYVDRTRAWADSLDGSTLFVEVAVPISQITGEEGATGTSDAIIVGMLPGEGRQAIVCRDLKYGQGVAVSAVENDQALMYAGGAIEYLTFAYDFADDDLVVVEIDQPRRENLSTWQLTVGELKERLVSISADAKQALADDGSGERTPGEHCKFCPAKADCGARADKVSELTTGSAGFTAPLTQQAAKPAVDRLGEYYGYLDMVRQWCKDVDEAVHARLLAGQPVEGYKLVQGKAGNRVWAADVDKTAAELKALGVPEAEMFTDPSLRSPAQIEKLLPKESRKSLGPLTKRAEGKPTVAPESDPRPPFAATGAEGFSAGGVDETDNE